MDYGLDFSRSLLGEYLQKQKTISRAVPYFKEEIKKLFSRLPEMGYFEYAEGVWAHESSQIARSSWIDAPCVIGENSIVRHCAFLRGSVLIGNNCVVGNSVEIKNSVLFDEVKAPHLSYVGDSVLGYRAHLGAGVICSNQKADGSEVGDTGLRKLGAVVCDFAEVGCNSVLCPGAVVGRRAVVYPLCRVRGVVEENCIFKGEGKTVLKR